MPPPAARARQEGRRGCRGHPPRQGATRADRMGKPRLCHPWGRLVFSRLPPSDEDEARGRGGHGGGAGSRSPPCHPSGE
jgi:hypothetical protein